MIAPTRWSPLRVASLASSLALALGPAGCSPAPGPGLREVVEGALERHRERVAGVRAFTLVVEIAGIRDTMRLEREALNGVPVFVRASETGARRGTQDPYAFLAALTPENAALAGRDTVEGEPCRVIVIRSFDDPELAPFFGPLLASGIATPERMELCLDVDEHLPRRVSFRGTMALGEPVPMTYTVRFLDYRETGDLVYPFLTEASVAVEPPDSERAPAGPLLDHLDTTVRVLELRVNEGRPEAGHR